MHCGDGGDNIGSSDDEINVVKVLINGDGVGGSDDNVAWL